MFSKACEYSIRACIVIAQNSLHDKRVSLKEIADAIDSPEAFTAKLLQKLVRHKIIFSTQGPQGGFQIKNSKLKKITLEKIIQAIDGEEKYDTCVLGLTNCSEENPCPAHKKYKSIKKELKNMLRTTSVLEMVEDIEKGKAFLKSKCE